MRYGVRWPEELIMKAIFRYHPLLANKGILYDGSTERRLNYTLEGGDVHPLREDLRGHRLQRALEPRGHRPLASLLFAHTKVTDIIIVVMPKEDTAIHLDMIFTQVDRELCVVLPAALHGAGAAAACCTGGRARRTLREKPDIFAALRDCGMPIDADLCRRRAARACRSASSGRPAATSSRCGRGSCSRMRATSARWREMERAGFAIVPAVDFLDGTGAIADDERAVITFEGAELVRGGGGPRCMTLPGGARRPVTASGPGVGHPARADAPAGVCHASGVRRSWWSARRTSCGAGPATSAALVASVCQLSARAARPSRSTWR